MNIKFNNRRGLPGGPNEVTSKGSISVEGYKEGSPDFNNDFNIIESSNITMEGVPFPVMGTDNFGNSEIMMPDLNYQFPGDIVIEIPLAQVGGTMDTAYDDHPFEKFAESQGMDVQEALQIVLSSPQAYPIEIVQAARDYQLERKRTNPVNDKQDEKFYSTKDQQELEEAQDGTETSIIDFLKSTADAVYSSWDTPMPAWTNPYNYSGDFNKFGIPKMYPTVEGGNLNEAFSNAQKNHADSEMFIWRGERYLNEKKGEAKHDEQTQQFIDRIMNSDDRRLTDEIKQNFINEYTRLNSPAVHIYEGTRDYFDNWSLGQRPTIMLKNTHPETGEPLVRSDYQLLLDFINEATHTFQHNERGRAAYLKDYAKDYIEAGGDQDVLYHTHGTMEEGAHAGPDIRPIIETNILGAPISEIGSRSNKKVDEEMEQLKKYKAPANVPDDPHKIKLLPIAETGEELDSDGEIDEEDFSAFSANMELTDKQKSKSEEIAGYVRNEDGDLMLGVDYGDVTPMGGTAPLGFAGGIPKLLKGVYYGSKGLSEYLKKVDGGSIQELPTYQDQGEVLLPMEELENVDLIEPANQNYYPGYDFYDISKQKENLIEKYNSPAFKDRYFKQYKNVTGNDMTEDEWNRRIAEQIEYTRQVPDQATPINYDLPVNDKNQFEFYTEEGINNLSRMNPDLLQNIINQSRGHVEYKLNEDTGEFDFKDLALLGPREFEALARFYAPGGPESFSYLYGEDGIHPYADIIKEHEVSHLYNSPHSPLWRGVEGYTTPTNELDFYKNIFDQQGKYDQNFIEEQLPHISDIGEIGAGKVMFEKALKDFNIWDPNEGPFTEKNYKKLIKNLDNPDFLAHPGTGAGGFISYERDPLRLVGEQNEGATYLDDLGILNPTGILEDYTPWSNQGYVNLEFPQGEGSDFDKSDFFSGDEISPRNQLLESQNILEQIDSKYQVPEHLDREGDKRRTYKRRQRFENKNVKDFLSDKFTLDDLETGATWYGEDGYYNEEGNFDQISGITVPFTGRSKRILQNIGGKPLFPRDVEYYGSVRDKKPIDLIGDDRFEGLFASKNHLYFSSKYDPKNYKLHETFEMDIPGYKDASREQQQKINKQFSNFFTKETHKKINDILKKNSRFHKENSEYYGDKPDDWQFERQELTEEELQYLKNFEQNYINLKDKVVNDLYDHYENKLNDTKENVFKYLNEIAMDEDDGNVTYAKYGAELPSYQDQGQFNPDDGVVKVGKKEYPVTYYNEDGVPMISTDYGSRDHRYLYNQLNELDQVDLIDNDPVLEYADYLRDKTGKDTDFMGIEWERSNYNKPYLRRQQLTNPVFNAVVDPLYGGIGGLQATTKAIDYGIKAIPVLTTGAVAGPSLIQGAGAVLSTPIPYTGTTVGGGLNLAGGLYSGYSLPGDVKDFVEDPSLRTGANVALDLAGITFGGLEVANMASKFKYSPLLKNAKNPNLKPSYSGITEKQFTAEEMALARESMDQGYNYSQLANSRVTDLQNRMLTPEFRLRMKGLIDEEIIGPGKLFSKRPVTEPGKVNQYERLVNSTIDDMIADASQMRIVNTTEDLGQFRFYAPLRNNNPGAIQAGLPRIALNKNLPYSSRANIPVTDHEIGHFFQAGINKYLPYNLGKIHPKHFDNPNIRQSLAYKLTKDLNEIYPEYTSSSFAYNTDIDRAIQMGLKVNPNYKIGPGSKPDNVLNNMNIKDMSSRQVDYILRNLGKSDGTEKSYNYFSRMLEPNLKDASQLRVSSTNPIGTSREGLPYLAELRADMLQRGFIKNTYDEITPSLLNRYLTTIDAPTITATPEFMPRIPQFMSKDPSNINFLSQQLNRLPAIIPPAIATPFLLDEQSGGPRYDDGGESYGPITLQDTFKDGDDDGLPVGIDRDDSTEVGKDILLLQAMAESALDPNAISPAGAKGLTQIMPDTLTDYINATGNKDIDLTDYRDAMAVQKWYMNSLYNRPWINKGNQDQNVRLAKTLAAYNWGSTKLNNFLNEKKNAGVDIYSDDMSWVDDLPKETRDYVNMLVLRNDDKFEEKVKTLEDRESVQKYINAYRRKGGSVRKYSRLFKDYKKNLEGEKISPTVLKELYKLGLANKPNKKLNLKDIRFNFEYNLDDVNYKKGGQLNLNLNQQIKFYEDYIKGSFDNGPKQNRANQIFKKLNKMYHLQTKKTGGNVLSYLQSLARI